MSHSTENTPELTPSLLSETETPETATTGQILTSSSSTKKSKKNFFEKRSQVSKVKHGVLTRYLGAWFPILYRNQYRIQPPKYSQDNPQYQQIVYVDGFSGPGKYLDGDNGSPILAYELALTHERLKSEDGPDVFLIFVDKTKKHCDMLLENLIESKNKIENGASKVKYLVINGEFVRAMEWILSFGFQFPNESSERVFKVPETFENWLEGNTFFIGPYTPLLVFADPFGYNGKDMPMALMQTILTRSEKSEIFVNLITSGIRRFWNVESRTKTINLLMGYHEKDSSWKPIILEQDDAKEKLRSFLQHYHQKISEGTGQKHTCLFEMRDENNKLMYNLYYASPHNTGFQRMKDAMKKESQDHKNFMFSAFNGENPDFEVNEVSVEELKELVLEHFKGRTVSGFEITDFIERQSHLTQSYRTPLKRGLEDYQVSGNKKIKFDEITYDFTDKNVKKKESVKRNILDYFEKKKKD